MVSWLQAAMDAGDPFEFGELCVRPYADGFVIARAGDGFARPCVDVYVSATGIRTFAQFDDYGQYRPLPGARSLPGGWVTRAGDALEMLSTLEIIYPLATRHIEQQAAGTLRLVSLNAVLERQSGRYEQAAKLSDEGRATAVGVLCGACVREPAWAGADVTNAIPCPEPCSVIVSLCREAAGWELTPLTSTAPDRAVGFANFDTPGNVTREAWLRARFPAGQDERR